MKHPEEMDILKRLAVIEGIDPGRLFILDDVVYVMTGEDVTGTLCQVGTPHWNEAVNSWLSDEIQAAIDDPRPSIPHDEVMSEMDAHIVSRTKTRPE